MVANINNVEVKKAVIIDSYTQYSDKLHAILNYQEIIQTRMYKFKVYYVDGKTEIVTTEEGSDKYNYLMKYVGEELLDSSKTQTDTADELRKYKQLLDENVITQEEFDAKKKQLLGL